MSSLKIRYNGQYEYDEWLELTLAGSFAGTAGIYAKPDILAEFTDQLSAFPIDPDHPPTFEHGNILLRVLPEGRAGELQICVQLAEPFEGANMVRVSVPASYAGMQDLQRALRRFIAAPDAPLEFEIR